MRPGFALIGLVKISGFTFIRNGVELGYPFAPSIRSLLPLCDEIIVNVPRSADNTLERVRAIGDPKIRVIESEWDETLRQDGLALSHHTNLALRECAGDWCVYIQADEVLHEDTAPVMRAVMERELRNLSSLYHDDAGVKEEVSRRPPRFYDDDQKVKRFTGKHPAVMQELVAAADWTYTSRNPLIRFRRGYFWEDIALIVKRCTGLTVGVHRNYRLVK